PLPPEYGPPPNKGPHPGFLPPHLPGDGPMPMQMPPPTQGDSQYLMDHCFHTTHQCMLQTSPVQTACPHCQQAIVTRISHDVGLMNTLFCLFCFFVGCDLGCCLIDDLKDVTHTCPYYTYKRIC
uniref:Cell death-inducing p53-target protein 1 n=1 Tax=Hippocampus comes TaxID=109280 RepID=A0A3Q2Y8X2_HIPCM